MWAARLVLAVASGAAVYASYEPVGQWWAAIVGMAGLWAALSPWGTHAVSGRLGALIALLHSLGAYVLLLPWIGELVGNMPYLALAFFLSLYSLPLGFVGARLATRRWGAAAFAFVYVAVEWVRSSFPFGGFGWVKLAWGQISGPLAQLAPLGGAALVTLCVALLGMGVAALVLQRAWVAPVAVVIAALVAPLFSLGDAPATGTVVVGAVQGNVPRLGLDFNAQRRAVLANHAEVTAELAKAHPEVDLVLWPENSSDVNPFKDAQAMALIRQSVRAVQAPLLVGTLTVDEVGERNTMQVFAADGEPGEYHYKKYLQPFGETMPMRSFFRKFTDMVDLAGDFKPGDGPGVVHMGTTVMGVATCYEVSFDAAYRTSIRNGAQILTTPTNNATFGYSDMTYQQLAMSRFRALETDRAVVVPATSGVSAIVRADGSVTQQTGIFEPGYLVEELPLRDTVTPAVKYGAGIEALAVIIGLSCAVYAVSRRESTK